MRTLLSSRNLGPTPWIGMRKDESLEERSRKGLRWYNMDTLDENFVASTSSKS
jgi:hypothetical protein